MELQEKIGRPISDDTLEEYVKSVTKAMRSGLPDIVAHPDLFMSARDSFGEEERKAALAICDAAIETGIPLEINFGQIASKARSSSSMEELSQKVSYPSKEFWKIVAEKTKEAKSKGKELRVLFGKDAHYPSQLSDDRDYEVALMILGSDLLKELHFVGPDLRTYNRELIEMLEERSLRKSVQDLGRETLEESKDIEYIDDTESAEKSHMQDKSKKQEK